MVIWSASVCKVIYNCLSLINKQLITIVSQLFRALDSWWLRRSQATTHEENSYKLMKGWWMKDDTFMTNQQENTEIKNTFYTVAKINAAETTPSWQNWKSKF